MKTRTVTADIWEQGAEGKWRKLRNEEVHDLYASPDITSLTTLRTMRWLLRHMACMKQNRSAYTVFKRKKPLVSSWRRAYNNIKMNL
jgi:hypothetical protein